MTESPLFIRLYLDEDVSVLVAQLLRPHGFEVLTTRDAHNLGRSDAAQLDFATEHQWTLLTHNRCDYELFHEAAIRGQRLHAGILIASRRASDFELARQIMTVLNTFTAEEVANQLLNSKEPAVTIQWGTPQSQNRLLGLLQAPADRGSMDTQMVRNLGEPIPILSIGRMDEPCRLLFPLKQHAQ